MLPPFLPVLAADLPTLITFLILTVSFVSWIISLLILLARRFALARSTQVKSCLAIKRAQQGLAESGPCLCRKHGMYWGNGVISECAHRDGENCVFPCNG